MPSRAQPTNPYPWSQELKDWRLAQGIRYMTEAAKKLGVPYRTYQDWEAGRMKPSALYRRLIREKLRRFSAHPA